MQKIKNIVDSVDSNDLKQSFVIACSEDEFYQYVSKLKVEDQILMKYTSSLKDSFLEFENCKKCKSLNSCKNKVFGYCYQPEIKENKIFFSYVACSKYQEYLDKTSYMKNIDFFKLPKELQEASFKNIYKDDKARLPILKYFKDFMTAYPKEKKGLYLTGSFGSGKTYLIASLFNEMAKKGVKSSLVYYPELLRSLKSSFSSDYEEKFDYIKKVPLLLLDDIGAENVTSWSRDEVLGPILQYRMEEGLPTFFTSNLTITELENNLITKNSASEKVKARRIAERIRQLSEELPLVSENRRKS